MWRLLIPVYNQTEIDYLYTEVNGVFIKVHGLAAPESNWETNSLKVESKYLWKTFHQGDIIQWSTVRIRKGKKTVNDLTRNSHWAEKVTWWNDLSIIRSKQNTRIIIGNLMISKQFN